MPRVTLRSPLSPPARRRWLIYVVVICAAAGAAAYAVTAGGGSRAPTAAGRVSTESTTAFRSAVMERLRTAHLDYRWVVCVRTPHRFAHVRVVRCNVDFGEPHITAFCSVLRGGRLLTSEQDSAIPCGHDNAGFSTRVVQYG